MRSVSLALVVAACGDNLQRDAPPPPSDAAIDAPALAACAMPVRGMAVTTRKIGSVGDVPTLVTAPRGDIRLYVIERRGVIRIFEDEQLLAEPFLDLSVDSGGNVVATGELGMLGLAFHPEYASNHTFFVNYTALTVPNNPSNRYRDVTARCDADTRSCVEILSIPDFAGNHNGGMIEFGPDGYLYISTGDGGGQGDPANNGQRLISDLGANSIALLGKILRIDVNHKSDGKEYAIPTDNPFADGSGEPEIFAYGLRNPWRFSFDRVTGDVWIGDVGGNVIEELNFVRAGRLAGKNFGWSQFEGHNCFKMPCDPTGVTFAQDERTHTAPPGGDGWISIIGGQVYRGTCYPDLVGRYFYTDYGRNGLFTATPNVDDSLTITELPGTFPVRPTSLHEDARGELYLTDEGGGVYHLEVSP